MSKKATSWHSPHLGREVDVRRWGEVGTPVLLFPTAAGDAEECERFLMIDTLAPMLEVERIKIYSVDSIAGQAWLNEGADARAAARTQQAFDAFIVEELVPAIREDCEVEQGAPLELFVAGSSIGAFNALAAICRHPDLFHRAICMSGTYDLRKFLQGDPGPEYYAGSPLHFLPDLPEDSEQLALLRARHILLAHGEGRWEDPAESWRVAEVLGSRGIPNRVDPWSQDWDHDWPTWREMLPKYLDEFLPAQSGDEGGASAAPATSTQAERSPAE